MDNFDTNIESEYDYPAVPVGKTKNSDQGITSLDMEDELFLTLPEQDKSSSENAHLSTTSTSVDSGRSIASSLESNISTSLSLSSSPQRYVADFPYSSFFPVVHGLPNYTSLENSPLECVNGNPHLSEMPASSTHSPYHNKEEQQSCAINLTMSNVETAGTYDGFDRYTRSTFGNMGVKRHDDLATEHADFQEVMSTYTEDTELKTTEYQDTLGRCTTVQNIQNSELMLQNYLEQGSKIVDITEYMVSDTSANTNNTERKPGNKKNKNMKDTQNDSPKYKRRKDLSYDRMVGVSLDLLVE